MIRVALLDDYQGVALQSAPWDTLPQQIEVQAFHRPFSGREDAAAQLRNFQVVMALRERTPFPRALLEQLPELRLVATAGMRNAAIDLEAATELGIVVCGTAGGGVSTMELTWGLILALLRHIPAEHQGMSEGRWQTTVGHGLAGKTLGLVGLGNIGGRVAAVAHPFNMKVLAWSANLTGERAAECGAEKTGLDDLLARADVVSIHLKLSERTTGLLGARELGLMKPGAVLVNTSRGPIVEEKALVHALRKGALAGAALDVYDSEPLPAGHALRALDNVVLTPHLGYVTREVYAGFYGESCENIQAWLDGKPVRVLNEPVLSRLRPMPG